MQAVVHVLAPAGEVWKTTELMPRLEVATALSITTPRSGVPGSVSVTATVLKLAAALKVWFGFVLCGHERGLRRAEADRQQDGQQQQRGERPKRWRCG